MFDNQTFTGPDASYYLPSEEEDDTNDRREWQEYCQMSKRLDTDDIMVMVGEAFSNSDILRALVDEVKAHPFHPDERKRLHVGDAMRLGDETMRLIAQAMDDVIGILSAMEVSHAGRR